MYQLLLTTVFAMSLMSCASTSTHHSEVPSVTVVGERVDLNDTKKVTNILNQQYTAWRNVKYRFGGLSNKGIDCSGLVYKTYREKLGINVPRSTEYQSKIGRSINKGQLKAGDLVFFKTGLMTRHVGMYIDKGNFLHVSSSKGVKISNIENPYWANVYWKSRRL
jgi:cell wall-associated NlpC family hydrolase